MTLIVVSKVQAMAGIVYPLFLFAFMPWQTSLVSFLKDNR